MANADDKTGNEISYQKRKTIQGKKAVCLHQIRFDRIEGCMKKERKCTQTDFKTPDVICIIQLCSPRYG